MKSIQLSQAAMYQIELALLTRIDEAIASERDYQHKAWGAELAKTWAKNKEKAIAALTEFRAQIEYRTVTSPRRLEPNGLERAMNCFTKAMRNLDPGVPGRTIRFNLIQKGQQIAGHFTVFLNRDVIGKDTADPFACSTAELDDVFVFMRLHGLSLVKSGSVAA